ncbi:MAG: hypothetical protein NTX68_12385 [Rhodococcus sp.]|nr:hypothetical protein [Rhodococcus sp. (in: high G+C Gram-positive bacteria)]
MFHTGAPIGMTSESESVTAWYVTSTAASVGPYRLCSSTEATARRSARAVVGGSASPEANISRSEAPALRRRSTSGTNTDIIDGTKCTTETRSRAMTSSK